MGPSGGLYLTGGTGFIGSAVAEALHREGPGFVSLGRRPAGVPGERWSMCDLRYGVPEDALASCRTLIHAASYVGDDSDMQRAVNIEGTRRLIGAARQAGVEAIVYLSTAGVYGRAFPVGQAERTECEPASPLSASRYEAERIVLDAGGTVVRPNLVYGMGDRWFLVPLIKLMQRIGGWVGDGTARLSVIDSTTLGKAVAELAAGPHEPGAYHAAYPRPVAVRDLVGPLMERLGVGVPDVHHNPDGLADRLSGQGVSPSQIAAVSQDRWFDTTRLWSTIWGGVLPKVLPVLAHEVPSWYQA